jgi:DNA-binding NtrC family response regulator
VNGRILIVDDEEIVIRSCLRILGEGEYEIDAVRDGLEALRKVAERDYDVLILDIMMPKIGGLEVLRKVKEAHPDIEVIMVTGLSQAATAVDSMNAGAFDYLAKPFEPDELELMVERALAKRKLRQHDSSYERQDTDR